MFFKVTATIIVVGVVGMFASINNQRAFDIAKWATLGAMLVLLFSLIWGQP